MAAKKTKKKEPVEDHSNYKIEVWDDSGHKRTYTMTWDGHMCDKDKEPEQN